MYSARQEALKELMRKLVTVLGRECNLSNFGRLFCGGERVERLQISVLSCTRPRLNDRDNVDYLILSSGLSGCVNFEMERSLEESTC
jgi:hypothetical protein